MQLELTKVLLLGSASQTIIGRPILPDATVHAVVEEHVSVSLTCLVFYNTGEAVLKKKVTIEKRIDESLLAESDDGEILNQTIC